MTKVISIDDMEIEFEKQNPESSCKWCVYIRIRKKKRISYYLCSKLIKNL